MGRSAVFTEGFMANKISSLDRLANVISDFAAWFHYDFLGLEDYMPIFEKVVDPVTGLEFCREIGVASALSAAHPR